jgi:hypothetical protein
MYITFVVNQALQADKGFMLLLFNYTCGMTS